VFRASACVRDDVAVCVRAIPFAGDSVAVWVPCFRPDTTRPHRCCTACWRPGVVLASGVSRRPLARDAAAGCLLFFFCWFQHARSYSTIGGGYGNAASGKCVLAVAAPHVVGRSFFMHVLVSLTVGATFSVGLYVLAVAAQRRSCFVHVRVSVTALPCA
jgi:hypothetical protein